MLYIKLKRTWSHNEADTRLTYKFREVFPELGKISIEELTDRLIDLKLDFYSEVNSEPKSWNRFTLPFAIILAILMFIYMPLNFMVKGRWGYDFGKENRIYNWFKSLKLL